MTPHQLAPGAELEKALRSGFRVPVYGIGTWGMGGRTRAN